jgi:alpha-beta hydrolase superfamily lysophospholipase
MSTHRTMQVPSGELTVHVWSPEQGPTAVVLLAHGYAEHAGRYEHVAQWLTDAGAMVVAPDQRGHGLSPGERGLMRNLDEYAEDLSVVSTTVAAEHEGLPIGLIGHSMGGNIAIRFIQLGHGDGLRALVLSGPVAGGNPEVFALANHDPIVNVPVDPAVLSRDSDVGQAFRADPLVYHGPYLRETLAAYRTSVTRIAASGSLGEVPTLWVHGEHDFLAPLDLTRAALEKIRGPRFEEIVYAGARHEIFNEINAVEVIGDVVSFVTRCVTPS